jgi:hypothetical protein
LAKFHVQVQNVDPDNIITIMGGGRTFISCVLLGQIYIYICGPVFLGPTYRDHHHRLVGEVTNAPVLTYTYRERERERESDELDWILLCLTTLIAEKNVFVPNSVFLRQF